MYSLLHLHLSGWLSKIWHSLNAEFQLVREIHSSTRWLYTYIFYSNSSRRCRMRNYSFVYRRYLNVISIRNACLRDRSHCHALDTGLVLRTLAGEPACKNILNFLIESILSRSARSTKSRWIQLGKQSYEENSTKFSTTCKLTALHIACIIFILSEI